MAYKDIKLKADPILYQRSYSENVFTLREARAEYSRLMKIVNKRLQRLGKSEFADSKMYTRYKDAFKPLPRGLDESSVRKALADVAEAAQKKTISIEGQKDAIKNYVASMNDLKYSYVTEKNARQLGELFRQADEYYQSKKAYDSEQIIDAHKAMFTKGGKPRKKYVEHTLEEWLKRKEQPQNNNT